MAALRLVRGSLVLFLSLSAAAIFGPGRAEAQAAAEASRAEGAPAAFGGSPPAGLVEDAVAVDSSGVHFRINRELRSELGLWPGLFPHFVEAQVLVPRERTVVGDGTSFVLQVTETTHGRLSQRRIPLSASDLEWLQTRLDELFAARPSVGEEDGAARNMLIVGSTLLGLGFYSWGVPVALDVEEGRKVVATSLLTVSASFALPYFLTRDRWVSPGATNLALYGGTRGAAHGWILQNLIEGDDAEGDNELAAAMSMSVVEGVGGYLWASHAKLSAGRAHLIGVGGDLGLLAALAVAEVTELDRDPDGRDRQPHLVAYLTGAGLGLAGGSFLGARSDPTWGDAEFLRTSALLGAGTAAAVTWLLVGDDGESEEDAVLAGALVGAAGGVVLGDRLTRPVDFSPGEAVLVDLVSLAGGALGAGLAYLATTDVDEHGEGIALSAAVGAAGGYALLYRAFARRDREGRDLRGQRLHRSRGDDALRGPAFSFALMPDRAGDGLAARVELRLRLP